MFPGCLQDFSRMFSGCSNGSYWPGGIWWSFQMKVWTLKIQRNPMIPNYSMIPAAAIRWSPAKTTSHLTFPQFFISLPSNCLRAGASAIIGLSHHYNGGHHLIIILHCANATEFSITLRANVTQNSSCGNVFPFASVLPSDYSWNHFWILSVQWWVNWT